MCLRLNNEKPHQCKCQFAEFCKRRQQLESVQTVKPDESLPVKYVPVVLLAQLRSILPNVNHAQAIHHL